MNIVIHVISTGEKLRVNVHPDASIKDLKCSINDNFEYPYKTLRLVTNDDIVLKDNQLVSDFLKNDIHLVFKNVQGGGFTCGNGFGIVCILPCCIGKCNCC